MTCRKGGGSILLSVSGLETKRTNSKKMPHLIPVAERETKLFSNETCDYYQWIHYCYRSHNIVLWWSCGYYQWIRYYHWTHKIVLWCSCDCSTRLYLQTRSQFSLTLPCSLPLLIILNSWLKINSPEAWVEAINSFICQQIKFTFVVNSGETGLRWYMYTITIPYCLEECDFTVILVHNSLFHYKG